MKEKIKRIKYLKYLLKSTDYKTSKYVEGALSEEEFAELKVQKQAWRDEINVLEAEIEALASTT